MRTESIISKWGNSLAVRIPLALANQARLGEGDAVTLAIEGDAIKLRPVRKKYDLSKLVAGITPRNRHAETAWGPPKGKESW